MKKVLLVFSSALLVFCCDNSPEPSPFLRLEIKDDLPSGWIEQWIFATNEAGELLDVQPLTKGTVLATNRPFTKYDLTFVRIGKYSDQNGGSHWTYDVETYRDFTESVIVQLGFTSPPSPAGTGTVKVNITNYDGPLQTPSLILPELTISSTNDVYPSVFETFLEKTYSLTKVMTKEPDKIVVTGTRAGKLVYHIFDNVVNGNELTKDFSGFLPLQNTFTIPEARVGSVGFEEGATGGIVLVSSSQNGSRYQMGTVPGFARYYTSIHTDYMDYTKLGTTITSFNSPQHSFTVANTSVSNFQTSLSTPHDYQSATWRAAAGWDVTYLQVHAGAPLSPAMNYSIPSGILSRYPTISTRNFEYVGTYYCVSHGTYTYADLLAEQFNGKTKTEFEKYQFGYSK